MVSPTPLLERRPKNRALATAFGQNGRPGHGRRANQTGSAVAGRRLASRRAVRPSRAAWATVAASRGPSGARRSSRSGEPPRFGAGARGGGSEPAFAPRRPDELRVALRARPHGPAPAGHPAVRDNPIETLRSPALFGNARPGPTTRTRKAPARPILLLGRAHASLDDFKLTRRSPTAPTAPPRSRRASRRRTAPVAAPRASATDVAVVCGVVLGVWAG